MIIKKIFCRRLLRTKFCQLFVISVFCGLGEFIYFCFMILRKEKLMCQRYSFRPLCGLLRYAVLVALVAVCFCACTTHRPVKRTDVPSVSADTYVKGHSLSKRQRLIIEEACSWMGTPYKYGGAEKGKGTDCSGLVLRVYLDVTEIKLPRNSAKQAEFCKSIKAKDVRPCDLVFFATGSDPERVSHVGMMLDAESFIHASSSKGVTVTRLDNVWYAKRLLGFGRVPGM